MHSFEIFLLSSDWSLKALLYKRDMKSVHIPLESFDVDKEDTAGSAPPGNHAGEVLVIFTAKDSSELSLQAVLEKYQYFQQPGN
jgi:hypothetical protein